MGAMTNMGAVRPLTVLDDDESMLRGMVADFAKNEIGPNVRRMDDEGVFDKGLLRQMFELGLMGVEIPEEYGGQGGTFFQALIVIEEIAAVDPSAAP
jgi:butyryl-CoA dehydrogenase/short/branched chain acyl-CoA dehydrogenase